MDVVKVERVKGGEKHQRCFLFTSKKVSKVNSEVGERP